jgi:hypothetical protein
VARKATCTSFNSFSNLPYSSSCFTPYLCRMSSEASSMTPRTRLISSSVSVASNWGLLAHVFFLAEGFYEETFLFCGVSAGGYFGGVASPSPFFSPSSPPPYPSAWSSSPPPPAGEPNPFSSEALSSSSVSIFWTSSYFFFFFVLLDCPTCST